MSGGFTAAGCAAALLLQVARSAAQDGSETTITVQPSDPGPKAKPFVVRCWLPADCKYVRGVVVADPMIKDVATAPLFRKVAVEESLGMICASVGAPTGKEAMPRPSGSSLPASRRV